MLSSKRNDTNDHEHRTTRKKSFRSRSRSRTVVQWYWCVERSFLSFWIRLSRNYYVDIWLTITHTHTVTHFPWRRHYEHSARPLGVRFTVIPFHVLIVITVLAKRETSNVLFFSFVRSTSPRKPDTVELTAHIIIDRDEREAFSLAERNIETFIYHINVNVADEFSQCSRNGASIPFDALVGCVVSLSISTEHPLYAFEIGQNKPLSAEACEQYFKMTTTHTHRRRLAGVWPKHAPTDNKSVLISFHKRKTTKLKKSAWPAHTLTIHRIRPE